MINLCFVLFFKCLYQIRDSLQLLVRNWLIDRVFRFFIVVDGDAKMKFFQLQKNITIENDFWWKEWMYIFDWFSWKHKKKDHCFAVYCFFHHLHPHIKSIPKLIRLMSVFTFLDHVKGFIEITMRKIRIKVEIHWFQTKEGRIFSILSL